MALCTQKQNNLDVMLFGPSPNPLTGLQVRVGDGLYPPQKTNLGPVVGFAWAPTRWDGKTVLRGDFGISYNQNEIAVMSSGFGNPPNAVSPFFHRDYPYTTNPSCAGTGILYETAGDIKSIFGYAPNTAAISLRQFRFRSCGGSVGKQDDSDAGQVQLLR